MEGFQRQPSITTRMAYTVVVSGVKCRVGRLSLFRSLAISLPLGESKVNCSREQSSSHTATIAYDVPWISVVLKDAVSSVLSIPDRLTTAGGDDVATAATARCTRSST